MNGEHPASSAASEEIVSKKDVSPVASSPSNEPPLGTALSKLAEGKPQVLHEIMMGFSSMGNPLHAKMTPEHITQVLNLATQHDERQFILTKQTADHDSVQQTSTRRYFFSAFAIIAAIAILLIVLFRDQPTILAPCLSGLGGFLGGAAAGFGIGRQKR